MIIYIYLTPSPHHIYLTSQRLEFLIYMSWIYFIIKVNFFNFLNYNFFLHIYRLISNSTKNKFPSSIPIFINVMTGNYRLKIHFYLSFCLSSMYQFLWHILTEGAFRIRDWNSFLPCISVKCLILVKWYPSLCEDTSP